MLISYEDALRRALHGVGRLDTERVGLADAADRVLAEDVVAARSMPPFSHSAMDGYALRAEDCASDGVVRLRVIGEARAGAEEAGLTQVDLRKGDALALPVDDASVDVVISNGVLNLAPDKTKAFREVLRVLRPGGRLQLADIVMDRELSEDARRDIELWAG